LIGRVSALASSTAPGPLVLFEWQKWNSRSDIKVRALNKVTLWRRASSWLAHNFWLSTRDLNNTVLKYGRVADRLTNIWIAKEAGADCDHADLTRWLHTGGVFDAFFPDQRSRHLYFSPWVGPWPRLAAYHLTSSNHDVKSILLWRVETCPPITLARCTCRDWWPWVLFQYVAFRRTEPCSHCQCFDGQLCYWKNNPKFLILATVVASTMFIWDYMLTFRMEVEFVWNSKWNIMKGLYLFQRYLPFIDTTWLALYRQFDVSPKFSPSFISVGQTGENLTKTACWNLYHASGGS